MGTIILNFIKKFIIKYCSSVVIEKLIIAGAGELVKRTDSKFDDKVYHIIFHQTKEYEECEKCDPDVKGD